MEIYSLVIMCVLGLCLLLVIIGSIESEEYSYLLISALLEASVILSIVFQSINLK